MTWSSSSTGCERDNPFDIECQTAHGNQTLDNPGCPFRGLFFRSVEYRYIVGLRLSTGLYRRNPGALAYLHHRPEFSMLSSIRGHTSANPPRPEPIQMEVPASSRAEHNSNTGAIMPATRQSFVPVDDLRLPIEKRMQNWRHPDVNVHGLEQLLRRYVEGEVRFDEPRSCPKLGLYSLRQIIDHAPRIDGLAGKMVPVPTEGAAPEFHRTHTRRCPTTHGRCGRL